MYSPKKRFRLFRDPAFTGGTNNIITSLTTSLDTYNAAANGSWVSITSNEYVALQANVSNTSIGMTTNSLLAVSSNGNFSATAFIATNVVDANCPAIPANSYVYAAVYRYAAAGQSGIQLYQNTASNVYSNFTRIGSNLPTTVAGYNYVVLKDASSLVVTPSIVSIYTNTASASNLSFKTPGTQPTTVSSRYANVNTNVPITTSTNLSTSFPGLNFAIQTLSTTSKQW